MARVLMMVINPMTADTRVEKEADSLGRAGHDVTVLATHLPGLAEAEERGTYRVVRLPYRRVVKDRLVRRRRGLTVDARDQRHALVSALRHPPRRLRLLGVAMTYLHLVRLRLRLVLGLLEWLVGGALMKAVRSRILPIEYWRGTVVEVPRLLERCDIIHAHDLGTLAAAVRLADGWQRARPSAPRPRVVYDSHEYYVEQNTRWTPLEKRLWQFHERRWIRRADAVITVSPGIAQALERRYHLPEMPTVIYNVPPSRRGVWDSDVRGDAGLSPTVPLVVYVGGVKPGRGVERLIPALSLRPDLHLAIIGAGHTSDPHLAAIVDTATAAGVQERLHVLAPVPAAELPSYLATADGGVHPMEPICLNHEFALPNKLFDYVFAGLPVAVSDLTEMRRFVAEYGVGTMFDPMDPDSTAMALGELVDAGDRYRPSPAVQSQMRDRFGWPAQEHKLLGIYSILAGTSTESPS